MTKLALSRKYLITQHTKLINVRIISAKINTEFKVPLWKYCNIQTGTFISSPYYSPLHAGGAPPLPRFRYF
jgi:hypothetical protein